MAEVCLSIDVVIFTISGYLPGEYVVRVFPLVNKCIQSLHYQLSLLGSPAPSHIDLGSAPVFYISSQLQFFDLEGEIYGIYSFWRDLQRIVVARGHSVRALKLNCPSAPTPGTHPTFPRVEREGMSLLATDPKCTPLFPCVERVEMSCYYFDSISHERFPSLTMISIDNVERRTELECLLTEIWTLPLTSLTIKSYADDDDDDGMLFPFTTMTPAFAHTLRFLHSDSPVILEFMARYCRQLHTIKAAYNFNLLTANINSLTSLTIWEPERTFTKLHVDLSKHNQLVELKIKPIFTRLSPITLPTTASLRFISMHFLIISDADKSFLQQCGPTIQLHLSVMSSWEEIITLANIIPHPSRCKLTLAFQTDPMPSLDVVETVLLSRGFEIANLECLLKTIDAAKRWRRIKKLAPQMKEWKVLVSSSTGLTSQFLTSTFLHLRCLYLYSPKPWNEKMLMAITQACPSLTLLDIDIPHYSGAVTIHSNSLSKLILKISYGHQARENQGITQFDLKLINLKKLLFSLPGGGEGTFLQHLLNNDNIYGHPHIQLPLLRFLSIDCSRWNTCTPYPKTKAVYCTGGHSSLTHLSMKRNLDDDAQLSSLDLRNLPCLRSLVIEQMQPNSRLLLQLPGVCDISLTSWESGNESVYTRCGTFGEVDFNRTIYYAENCWVEEENNKEEIKEESKEESKEEIITQTTRNQSGKGTRSKRRKKQHNVNSC